MASARRVNEVLDTVPEVQDAPQSVALSPTAEGRLVFEDVSFQYAGSGESVLENINLTVEPGQTVAILGSTGAGKSTLVNLVPRFYDVTAGRILLDGQDIRDITQDSLLAQIGIVPQETVLFSGTVRDNICYGLPGADDQEIFTAARAAQAHEFISGLSKGYDTHVEERGSNFSGGQKQRIAIARALLTRPKILILDDSTSSVDVETETKIQEALETVLLHPGSGTAPQRRTSLVVAQRISTVLNADKIVVIDNGRIVAEGKHQQLMQSSPIYQEIYESQLGNGFRLEEAVSEKSQAGAL
jgi:ATP-binding cassette subfamily B protein